MGSGDLAVWESGRKGACDERGTDMTDRHTAMQDPSEPASGIGAQLGASEFVRVGLLAEIALGLAGWALGLWRGIDWAALLQWSPEAVLWGVAGGLLLVGVHLVLLLPGGAWNPLYRTIVRPLVRMLRPRLRGVRTTSLVLLAIASGIGEEVLFRGWLQAEVGLVAASLLFGTAHVWDRTAWPYGLYTAGMGGLLGGLLTVTGSLWAPVLAHTLNNLLGFLVLRDGWLALPSEQGDEGGDG